jgi:hypothetical protein
VGANVLMAILADFMLVWLPAPTYALSTKQVRRRRCARAARRPSPLLTAPTGLANCAARPASTVRPQPWSRRT